jgi:hypothetical protein
LALLFLNGTGELNIAQFVDRAKGEIEDAAGFKTVSE